MFINDPVHGFIEIGEGLIRTLVQQPVFVRLNRIEQLGPTSYVYPGGRHTRFSHSVGALHLITNALRVLQCKGCDISAAEAEAAKAAMLLHDLGHGPMSHCLEEMFVRSASHEQLTLLLMEHLNVELDGALDMAIEIFRDTYSKHFLHELICSQLDMDRLDYLCRDSFFAGVREGNIGAERIIKMLCVKDDRLVVEAKGIYTIENYLMARRLMYWQVYLHKTALAARETLTAAMERANELIARGVQLPASSSLAYFLYNKVDLECMRSDAEAIAHYIMLDDSDIITALKQWAVGDDRVLAILASNYIDRHLYKARELTAPLSAAQQRKIELMVSRQLGIALKDAHYFVRPRKVSQMLYSTADDHICVLMKDGSVRDISNFSELLHSEMVDRRSERHYLFTPRGHHDRFYRQEHQ